MNETAKYNHVLGAGKQCALLVSDMQNAYTRGNPDDNFNQDEELKNIVTLVEIAHARKIPVIYTVISFTEDEISHPNMWLQKIPRLGKLKEGTPEVELDSRLPFEAGNDLLLVKKNTSSFFGTSLANQLITQNIDTLIVTGCTTSGCVRATTVDGLENGFRMMVVREAVADRWKVSHEQTLIEINAKYGDVIGLEEAKKIMTTLGRV